MGNRNILRRVKIWFYFMRCPYGIHYNYVQLLLSLLTFAIHRQVTMIPRIG